MKLKSFIAVLLFVWMALPVMAKNKTQVIAHRGYWKCEGSAQNSLRSLERADEIKVYGTEFDVHLTADNVPVVHHDNTIQGVDIQSTPYEKLKDLKLENGEVLPTLQSYLDRAKKLKVKLIFELKPHATPERDREAAKIVVDMINKMKLQKRTEYITFSMEAGKELIRLAPKAQVAYLSGNVSPAELKKLGYTGLDYHFNVMKNHPQWFKEAKDLGMTVNVWTIDDVTLMKEMKDMGADYLTTDMPEDALKVVKEK